MKAGPEPLTPPDCNLRDVPQFAFDITRVLDSDFFAISCGDEFKAAFALWLKSWRQVPAASLPNADAVLAVLSGTGDEWKLYKKVALRGWIECSDGRLYHPVIAEKALAVWNGSRMCQNRQDSNTCRVKTHRQEKARLVQELRRRGVTVRWNTPIGDLRQALAEASSAKDL